MLRTTQEQLLAAVGGTLARAGGPSAVTGASTDTRTLQPGDLYVPLRGERFDGHAFVDRAIAAGAAGLLFEEGAFDPASLPADTDVFAVEVDDTLRALGDLAHSLVARIGAPVVAVTGSAGKTSTKEMLAHVLGKRRRVCATIGNFNNLIGLPLTVFRAAGDEDTFVLEMGMSELEEIARLVAIAPPTVGIVTNVGAAHLESLRDLDTVGRAKGEMYEGLPAGATAVVNLDDARVVAGWERAGRPPRVTFGSDETADVCVRDILVADDATVSATLVVESAEIPLTLPVLGVHNVWNAAAAVAACVALGDAPPEAVAALADFGGARDRMERLQHDDVVYLSDCYNANPDAMKAALATLAGVPGANRRLAVLGDMLELGDHTAPSHRTLGADAAAAGVDHLVAVGDHAQLVADGAITAGLAPDRVTVAPTAPDATAPLQALLRPGDWVLLKASRGVKLERVLEGLGVRG